MNEKGPIATITLYQDEIVEVKRENGVTVVNIYSSDANL